MWRSTCSHCRDFLPELEKLYQKYHPLGLEVYALSTDNTVEDWRDFLQKQPTSWINVFVTSEKRNDVVRTYPYAGTPALIAFHKDRRVLSRVLSRENLEAYIEEVLREQ